MRYYLRKKEGTDSRIYYDMNLDRVTKVRGATNLSMNPKWNRNEAGVINTTIAVPFINPPDRDIKEVRDIELQLQNFIKFAEKKHDDLVEAKHPIINKELKREFDIHFKRKIQSVENEYYDFIDFPNYLIEHKDVSKGTKEQYKRSLDTLLSYQKKHKTVLTYDSINMGFYKKYTEFLRNQTGIDTENTVGKYIKTLKIFMNQSLKRNFHSNRNHQLDEFKVHSKPSKTAQFFTIDELKKIEEIKLNQWDSALRDYFLLMAYTGMRVEDMLDRKFKHITKDGNYIVWNENKLEHQDKDEMVFEVTPDVRRILKRWNGKFPGESFDRKFHKNYINDELKFIVRKAGIPNKYKNASCHDARRSFCSNEVLNKVPIFQIMQQSGHQKFKDFKLYVKATGIEVSAALSKNQDVNIK